MSVIIAKSAVCCGTSLPVSLQCFPAVSTQRIIPVGTTLTVDGVSSAGFRAALWFIVVSNGDGSRVRSYELLATHRNGSTPTFGYRSILGDSIIHTPNVTLVGGVMSLTLTNGDTEDLIVYVTRLALPVDSSQTNVLDTVEVGRARGVIRAGQTSSVDLIVEGTAAAATWMINTYTPSGRRCSSQIFVTLVGQISLTHYSLLGDRTINHDITVTEVAGIGYELSISNNDVEDIRVSMTRIPVQTSPSIDVCGASNGLDLWVLGGITVGPSATTIVDQIATPAHVGAKWLLGAMNTVTHETMVCEVNAGVQTTAPEYTAYGFIGDVLAIDINVPNTPGDITLTVTNNETSPVVVNLLRVPTAT